MSHRKKLLSASTALFTVLAATGPQTAVAQTAAGQMIPGCNPASDPVELADIDQDALEGDLTLEQLPQLIEQDVLCILPNGKLKVADAPLGSRATIAGEVEAETEPEVGAAETGADPAASDTPVVAGTQAGAVIGAETPGTDVTVTATGETGTAAEAEPETAEAGTTLEVTGETNLDETARDLAEDLRDTVETTADAVTTDAERADETTEARPTPGDDIGEPLTETTDADTVIELSGDGEVISDVETEIETSGDVVVEGEETGVEAETEVVESPTTTEEEVAEVSEPVTATAADATVEAEPVESVETTVTEENARSSDEDFTATATGGTTGEATVEAGSGNSGGGLSNFEKFALGAAGMVVLDQFLKANERVVENTGDRVVVQRADGSYYILKDDDVLLRRPGSNVKTETFADGSTRTTVTRPDGVKVVTITTGDGRVVRRVKEMPDGFRVVLFDDTEGAEPVRLSDLPPPPRDRMVSVEDANSLRAALRADESVPLNRAFTLGQVRNIVEVRELMPEINVDVNFETGSAAIRPDEARDLTVLGNAMREMIEQNPGELFLIEGHTDAVGSASMNLALSDRRAESVALALAEYFDVPPENMVVQGYGERFLLVPTTAAERANRRATVRRVTPLLTASVSN